MQDLNLELKRFDTLHDFGNTASNRSAQIGLNYLGITMPEINHPSPQNPANKLVPSLGAKSLYREKGFKLDNCKTMVRSNKVSYERQATAAIDSCALENAWSFTKNGSGITWDQLWIKEGEAGYIDPNTLGDVVVIANGTVQNNYYESTLRKNNNPAESTKRNIVGHWILKYMFPGYTGNQAVGVTFDAAGGKTVKVFSGMGQVKAIVTPQNISDSASTSLDPFADFKMLGHKRTEFLFPLSKMQVTIPEGAQPGSVFQVQQPDGGTVPVQVPENGMPGMSMMVPVTGWICTSQLYSKDWCNISFQNVNYNTNSPNGFKIRLSWSDGTNNDFFTIDYDTLGFTNAIGGGAAQGPSAPYLAGLINTIAGKDQNTAIRDIQNDANLKPDITTIIPLIPLIQKLYTSPALDSIASKLPTTGQPHDMHGHSAGKVALIVGLLFDFKRAGDYEQANAAKWAQQNDPSQYTILSTGDILCSTYSRSIRQPCILRGIGGGGANGSAIALFRFPDGATRVPNSKSYDFIVEMITKMEEISSVWHSKDGEALQTYLGLTQGLTHFATMAPQVKTWGKARASFR